MLVKFQNMISMAYKPFDKKSDTRANKFSATHKWTSINSENQQLAKELPKTIIKTFRKCKTYSSFRDNIWGADLADVQLMNKYNKEIRFLLCVTDIFRKKVLHLLMHFKRF